jgi:hypothetical protein
MATPIYIGNAKKHPKFDNAIVVGLRAEHLKTLSEHIGETGWVNILISPQRENKEKYSVKIDDFKPRNEQRQEERDEQSRQGFQPNDAIEPEKNNDLPF